jgi:hypothetical protein
MGAYKHGPLSSWPAIKSETPNGRDCAKQAQVKTNDTGAQQWFPEIQEKGH